MTRCPKPPQRVPDLTFPGRYGTGRAVGINGIFEGLEGMGMVEAP